jgi:hypothetical protein
MQHVFLQAAVDRYARQVRKSLPIAPATPVDMQKRFAGAADSRKGRSRKAG